MRLVDRLTMPWTDHVVCCSQAVLRSVQAKVGGIRKGLHVIPFGVEVSRFVSDRVMERSEFRLDKSLPVLGTICRLIEPKKGLAFLLGAVAALEREAGKPVCQLLIVGDGPARQSLMSLGESLGIAERIVFAGERRDIPVLLSVMDIFALPSLYEGFGIAILEAMAAGKPVIATTAGGIPEFVQHGHTGLLVPPADTKSLAAAIKRMLDNPDWAKVIGQNAQAQVRKQYTIESVVQQHEDLYELCLGRT